MQMRKSIKLRTLVTCTEEFYDLTKEYNIRCLYKGHVS